MKKAFKLSVILMMVLSLSSCDWPWEDDDEETPPASNGSESQAVATASTPAPQAAPAAVAATGGTETGVYWGRHNGNRPTWYFQKKMRDYPSSFRLDIPGCATGLQVSNNGHRWSSGGYIAKQSDVSGRGLAVVAPAACGSRNAKITLQ